MFVYMAYISQKIDEIIIGIQLYLNKRVENHDHFAIVKVQECTTESLCIIMILNKVYSLNMMLQ